MKVLVLGGTGAMGVHLVQYLAQNNIETVVTSRKQKEDKGIIKYLKGNARDFTFLKDVLKSNKWDAIVDFMVYSTSSFNDIVRTFLDSTDHYIFLSSARVYANSEKPITENSIRLLDASTDEEYLRTDEYALSKARQEDILKQTCKKNWTIIRPYITYSENRFQLGVLEKEEWLYRAMKGRTIVFSIDIASKLTTITYGLDVSKGIMSLINNPKASGNIFNITTKEAMRWIDILNIYLDLFDQYLNFRPKVLLQSMDLFFSYHPAKYQIEYDRLFNRQFDTTTMDQIIMTKEFISTRQGLEICFTEFLKNSEFQSINWRAEALKDRHTKEHTSLKEIPNLKNKVKYIIFRYLMP